MQQTSDPPKKPVDMGNLLEGQVEFLQGLVVFTHFLRLSGQLSKRVGAEWGA